MGTTHVLHYVFIQTQCAGEWKKTYAVWSAHGLRVPSNHSTDCFFLYGTPYSKWFVHEEKIKLYLNTPSAIWPVPHGDGHPVPEPPDNFAVYLL